MVARLPAFGKVRGRFLLWHAPQASSSTVLRLSSSSSSSSWLIFFIFSTHSNLLTTGLIIDHIVTQLAWTMSASLRVARRTASVLTPAVSRTTLRPALICRNRAFTTSKVTRADEEIYSPGPLLTLTEEEEMMKDSGMRTLFNYSSMLIRKSLDSPRKSLNLRSERWTRRNKWIQPS